MVVDTGGKYETLTSVLLQLYPVMSPFIWRRCSVFPKVTQGQKYVFTPIILISCSSIPVECQANSHSHGGQKHPRRLVLRGIGGVFSSSRLWAGALQNLTIFAS